MGVRGVRALRGGYRAWWEAGFPIEKPAKPQTRQE
jgi:3-mercaptopyruvate sulfurtransferase SseA